MRKILFLCLVALVCAMLQPVSAGATDAPIVTAQVDDNRLLVPGGDDAEPARITWWTRLTGYIAHKQHEFYRSLSGAIKAVRDEGSLAAAWGLVVVSFLYGVFHAAGPGHGKAVISAYLLADERLVRRGVILAFVASLFQAVSAIVLVSGAFLLVTNFGKTSTALTPHLETVSYGLIFVIGLYMLWSALRGHDHGHSHAHGDHDHDHHGHDHDHHHGHDASCGHAHMPTPAQLRGDWSLRKAASIAIAVGIRPCSGAIIVLVFAYQAGLYLTGMGSTLAMSLGTAITVSAIAILSVSSKALAARLLGAESRWLELGFKALAIIASLAIALLGAMLLYVSLTTSRPFI